VRTEVVLGPGTLYNGETIIGHFNEGDVLAIGGDPERRITINLPGLASPVQHTKGTDNVSNLTIVTGGQYGSEGKGAFIHELVKTHDYGGVIRVGGPQAGHSIKLDNGEVLKFKVVPIGAVNPRMVSIIGMASVVDLGILGEEMAMVENAVGHAPQVLIDHRATILDEDDKLEELNAEQTTRFGSTSKGVGKARERRIGRLAKTAEDHAEQIRDMGGEVTDTVYYLRRAIDKGDRFIVEAAQGQLLSLYSGGHYPFATSAECGPTGAFADLGLPLSYADRTESIGVFRTFPIRVAGNSGPLPGEVSWEWLQQRYGPHIPIERTTVTDKVRRVGLWDAEEARKSVIFTGIDRAVLTFVDYPFPEAEGQTDWWSLPDEVRSYVHVREAQLGVPIQAIGTSFGTYAWR
jgi:adenylosuccinate synthase